MVGGSEENNNQVLTIYFAGSANLVDAKYTHFRGLKNKTQGLVLSFDGPGSGGNTGGTLAKGHNKRELESVYQGIKKTILANPNIKKINFMGFSRGAVAVPAIIQMIVDDSGISARLKKKAINTILFDPTSGLGRKSEEQFSKLPGCVDNAAIIIMNKEYVVGFERQNWTRFEFDPTIKLSYLKMPGNHSDCFYVEQKGGERVTEENCTHIGLNGQALAVDFLKNCGTKFETGPFEIPVVKKAHHYNVPSHLSVQRSIRNPVINDDGSTNYKKAHEVYEANKVASETHINAYSKYAAQQVKRAPQEMPENFFKNVKPLNEQIRDNFAKFVIQVCDQYHAVTRTASFWGGQRSVSVNIMENLREVKTDDAARRVVNETMLKMNKHSRLYRSLDKLRNEVYPAMRRMKKQSSVKATFVAKMSSLANRLAAPKGRQNPAVSMRDVYRLTR